MPRDPRILLPAENLATLFLFNAIQFDSDVLMQDQHLLNDRKNWKEYKLHYPQLHCTSYSSLKLTYWSISQPCTNSHQKPTVKPDPRAICTSAHLDVYTSASSHLGKDYNGVQDICSSIPAIFNFLLLLHLFLIIFDNWAIINGHTLGSGRITAI